MKHLLEFKTLVFLSAMFITVCAAVFSVTGIGKLFAGAMVSAVIMSTALEMGKIVSISFLYRYWTEMGKMLKWYLMTASIVLMIITSAGIYGYLTAAYATVAAEPLKMNAEMSTLQSRAVTLDSDIERKNTRFTQLISLRTQQENRVDTLIARSTTGNTGAIRTAQNQITQYDRDMRTLQTDITSMSAVRDSLLSIRNVKEVELNTNAEIGTFLYIANMMGLPLDTVVKWFTLTIVLVFDPLAVALIIAFNFLIKRQNTTQTDSPLWKVYGDDVEQQAVSSSAEDSTEVDIQPTPEPPAAPRPEYPKGILS